MIIRYIKEEQYWHKEFEEYGSKRKEQLSRK